MLTALTIVRATAAADHCLYFYACVRKSIPLSGRISTSRCALFRRAGLTALTIVRATAAADHRIYFMHVCGKAFPLSGRMSTSRYSSSARDSPSWRRRLRRTGPRTSTRFDLAIQGRVANAWRTRGERVADAWRTRGSGSPAGLAQGLPPGSTWQY